MATLTAEFLENPDRVHLVAGDLGTTHFIMQRSIDGGIDWVDVVGGEDIHAAGTTELDDLDFTPGITNQYRLLQPLGFDTFNRVNGSSWNTATTGQVWALGSKSNGDGTYSTDGERAHIVAPVLSTGWYIQRFPSVQTNSNTEVDVILDDLLVGDVFYAVGARCTDTSPTDFDSYDARLTLHINGNVDLAILRLDNATFTTLAPNVTIGTWEPGQRWRIQLQCIGTTIRAKAWNLDNEEPAGWATTATDATYPSGQSYARMFKNADTTTVNYHFDRFVVNTTSETTAAAATIVAAVPKLTATFLDDLCRVRVTLEDAVQNVRYTLQRSTDGGATWTDVRGGGNMGTTGVGSVDDYEYAANQENLYRVVTPIFYDSFNREYPIGTTLNVTGETSSFASTPDAAALDVTGDIDLRADIAPATWPPPTDQTIMGKYMDSTNNRGYRLDVVADGRLRITWSTDGTNNFSHTSSVPVDIIGGGRIIVRATLDVNNGAGGRTATFYTSNGSIDNPGPWVQLGVPQTTGTTTSIFSNNAALEVGSRNGGNNRFIGHIFKAQVRNGIGGTLVANPDFTSQSPGTGSFADSSGRVWTVQSGAEIIEVSPVPGSNWGLADTGQEWNLGGSSSGFSVWVDNGVGVVRSTAPGGHIVEQVTDAIPGLENGDLTFSGIFPGTRNSLDQSLEWGVGMRFTGFTDGYEANLRFRTEADNFEVELRLGKFIADSYTLLATTDVGTWTTGVPWHVRFRLNGTNLNARAWQEGTAEPSNWSLFVTDADIVSGNRIFMRSFKSGGNEFEQWFGPIRADSIPPSIGGIAAVTPVQTEVCLKSITYPLLNRHIDCVDWDELTRDSRAGFFDIKGRHEILAITDVGSSASFNLTFVTHTPDEARGVRALLTYGGILYLQPPGDPDEDCHFGSYSGIPDGYVMWDGHVERHSVRGEPIEGWTVGFTRVADVDESIIPTTITWQMLWDMIGPDGTWETVWATWPTWQDLWAAQGSISSFNGGDAL